MAGSLRNSHTHSCPNRKTIKSSKKVSIFPKGTLTCRLQESGLSRNPLIRRWPTPPPEPQLPKVGGSWSGENVSLWKHSPVCALCWAAPGCFLRRWSFVSEPDCHRPRRCHSLNSVQRNTDQFWEETDYIHLTAHCHKETKWIFESFEHLTNWTTLWGFDD